MARRRRRWLRRSVQGCGALLILGAGGYGLLGSDLLALESVQVRGADGVTADQVRELAAVPSDAVLPLVDVDAVSRRVLADTRIASVEVRRSLPGTVVVTVQERRPVARVAGDGGSSLAVGADGVVIVDGLAASEEAGTGEATDDAATGEQPVLPLLDVETPGPDDPATRAGLQVLLALPPDVARSVTRVSSGGDGVRLRLTDGQEVRWGSPEPLARKSAVVAALLPQADDELDVRSPDVAVAG